jgi:DNA replication protein DnaC
MENKNIIRDYAKRLRLHHLGNRMDEMILRAQQDKPSYLEFLRDILEQEVRSREERDFTRRLSQAHLPARHDLDLFDFNFNSGINRMQMKQLRELTWLEQSYNVILMGPSGTGKTFIAAGLVYEAVKNGLKAYLLSMEEIITILRMRDLSPTAMMSYNKLLKADLIAIDDIMLLPVGKEEAVGFFNLINQLYEKTSVIITTNKAPTEWAEVLEDTVLTTALLDRLLYRCEIVKLEGTSYRLENRKTIFKKNDKPK